MAIKTYQDFSLRQKIIFYIGLPQVLNLFYWIVFLPLFFKINNKYRLQNIKEVNIRLLHYFGYIHLIIFFLIIIQIGIITTFLS